MLAAVATLGSGGPLGYEGPSLYAGAAIGSWFQRRFARYFETGAVREMEAHDTDRLAVCDDDRYIGTITANDLVQLDEVLHLADGDSP